MQTETLWIVSCASKRLHVSKGHCATLPCHTIGISKLQYSLVQTCATGMFWRLSDVYGFVVTETVSNILKRHTESAERSLSSFAENPSW